MKEEAKRLIDLIIASSSFGEVKNTGLLPEPDADDGYYFISYSHKDYKRVIPEIIALRDMGLRIWYDRGLESGKSWLTEVKKKMSSYYCRGVIFFISENFLSSESCVLELSHFVNMISKSCIYVNIDTGLDEAGEVLISALDRFTPDESNGALVELSMLVNPIFDIDAPIEDKAAATDSFAVPELIEYTYLYGSNNEVMKMFDLMFGRCALVSGIVDKNVRRVDIPATVSHSGKEYKVIGISSNAFFGCELLEEVTVSDGWMVIDDNAFVRCPMLKEVKLGKPMKRFGSKMGSVKTVFRGCPNAKITLTDEEIFYTGSFKNRNDIIRADLGEKQHIAGDCYSGCSSLRSARLYKKDMFGDRAFYNCISLRDIEIDPKNLTKSLEGSFYNCRSLLAISLPRRLKAISKDAFRGCLSLTEITVLEKVRYIDKTAFRDCPNLKTVIFEGHLPPNVTKKHTPYRKRVYLDELFPSAERIYLNKKERSDVFRGAFTPAKSDRRGYYLFVKEAQNDKK